MLDRNILILGDLSEINSGGGEVETGGGSSIFEPLKMEERAA